MSWSKNGNQAKKIHMNMDCLTHIVEELDFESLLNMAQTCKFYSNFAAEVFRRKFTDKTFVIDYYSSLNLRKYLEIGVGNVQKVWNRFTKYEDESSDIHGEYIEINRFDMILNTLRYFGKDIRKLKITIDNADSKESKIIRNFVNKYCSDAMIEFGLQIDKGNAINFLTKTFRNVQKVSFKNKLPVRGENGLSMNETFPALRILSLHRNSGNCDYLKNRLPSLEHVQINIGRFNSDLFIRKIFRANRNIRSVSLSEAWPALLRKVNNLLPNLEYLSVGTFEMYNGDEQIRFENVREFSVSGTLGSSLNILLPNLQELTIFLHDPRTGEAIVEGLGEPVGDIDWTDFMENHNHLRRFNLEYSRIIEQSKYFLILTDDLTNLEEMTVSSLHGEFIYIGAIERFIETHGRLVRFELQDCPDSDKEILREKFANAWNIRTLHLNGLLFERI